jgi:hypothetical protein
VHTTGDPAVTCHLETPQAEVVKAAASKLRKYNIGVIDSATFGRHARERRKELMPDVAREIPIDPLGLSRETVADWVFPYFIRADILAPRYQRRFRRLSWAIFALAALAVGVVAVQANFWPRLDWLAAFEVAFLVSLLLILQMSRRWRLHGVGTQRQFRRHSERYRRMAGVLAQVQREMADAKTLKQVQKVAAETEQIMREENSDWFGVMRFHDMELIT